MEYDCFTSEKVECLRHDGIPEETIRLLNEQVRVKPIFHCNAKPLSVIHNTKFSYFHSDRTLDIWKPISSSILAQSICSRCHFKAYESLFNSGFPHGASFLCAESQ